jgi:hypothetical protein
MREFTIVHVPSKKGGGAVAQVIKVRASSPQMALRKDPHYGRRMTAEEVRNMPRGKS